MFYTGLSFRRVADQLKADFHIQETPVAPETIRRWGHTYTCAAMELALGCEAPGGGTWCLCSQPIESRNEMLWIVVDGATGYILAMHLGRSLAADVAKVLVPWSADFDQPATRRNGVFQGQVRVPQLTVRERARCRTKLKPRWDVHLSGDDDQLGCAGKSLSSVLGE